MTYDIAQLMSFSSSDNPLSQASSTDTFWERNPKLGFNSDESSAVSESPDELRINTSTDDLVSPGLAEESLQEVPQLKVHSLPTIDPQSSDKPKPKPDNARHRNASLHLQFLRRGIFLRSVPKPSVIAAVPVPVLTQVDSSLQLASCVSLLSENPSHGTSDDVGEQHGSKWPWHDWLNKMRELPAEQRYLRHLVSGMVQAFVEGNHKDSSLIAEVSLLGPVLNRVDYDTLLKCLLENFKYFEAEPLLESHVLLAIIRLTQTAPPGILTNEMVSNILTALQIRSQYFLTFDKPEIFLLVFAIAKILEVMVMVSGGVADLNRKQHYQALWNVLNWLRCKYSDSFSKFNIDYAHQTILYLSSSEAPLHTLLKPAGCLPTEPSSKNKTVRLEPEPAINANDRLQQATITSDTRHHIVEANIEEEPWYSALRRASAFVRDGRMVEFSQLVSDVAYQFEPNFQHGICQILAEMAADPYWDLGNRRRAVDFLGHLFKTEFGQTRDSIIAHWVSTVASQEIFLDSTYIILHSRVLLEELLQECATEVKVHYPLSSVMPSLTSSKLLREAVAQLQLDNIVNKLMPQKSEERSTSMYIPLQAKPGRLDSNGRPFPLMEEMDQFLESERQVFLILGDSGSGKTTFCRKLEQHLWTNYRHGDRIPLYIDLPAVDQPEYNLIEKHLRQRNLLDHEVQKLLRLGRFVLICDGYDESRLTANLYNTNRLNMLRQHGVKMVIACRNTFLSHDYQWKFLPQRMDRYNAPSSDGFQLANIAPFLSSDICDYAEQAVHCPTELGKQLVLSVSEFMSTINTIPDMLDLVKNPFLLALAVEVLPTLSNHDLEPAKIKFTRLQLYNYFIKNWIQTNKARLQRLTLCQDVFAVFETLCEASFEQCTMDFLKELAEAIYEYQEGQPVVEYIHLKDKGSWKEEFLGPDVKSTLLREASPLTRAATRYKFIHHSFLEFFYALALGDPTDDDGDYPGDNGDDSQGRGNGPAGSEAGGTGSGGGGTGSEAGGGKSQDGGENSTIGHGGSGGDSGASGANSNSGGKKGSSGGDEEDSRRGKGSSHSKGKGTSARSGSATLMDRFSKRNLFKEQGVLQFLVERAQSDTHFKSRLWTIIDETKRVLVPSLAAANAITILFKSGERFHNEIELDSIRIPYGYISEAALIYGPTGADLLEELLVLADPEMSPRRLEVVAMDSGCDLLAPTITEFIGPFEGYRLSSSIYDRKRGIQQEAGNCEQVGWERVMSETSLYSLFDRKRGMQQEETGDGEQVNSEKVRRLS